MTDDMYGSESDYDSSSADDDARNPSKTFSSSRRRESQASDSERSRTEKQDAEKSRSNSASPAPRSDSAGAASRLGSSGAASPAPSSAINGDRPSSAKSSHSRRDSSVSKASSHASKAKHDEASRGLEEVVKDADSDSASEEEADVKEDKDPLPPPEVLLQRAHRRIRRLLRKASRKKTTTMATKTDVSTPGFDVTALDDFVRCIPLARIIFGDFHWRLARAYADLALAYLDLLQLPTQSLDHATTAKTLLTQNVHLSDNALEKV